MRAPSTGRLGDVLAGLVLVLGEFDNQNAILGGHCDQHDKADLGIKIIMSATTMAAILRDQEK
jgi:hypothetical protein